MPWQPEGEGRLLGDPPCGVGPANVEVKTWAFVSCVTFYTLIKEGLIGVESKSWGEGHAFNVYSC